MVTAPLQFGFRHAAGWRRRDPMVFWFSFNVLELFAAAAKTWPAFPEPDWPSLHSVKMPERFIARIFPPLLQAIGFRVGAVATNRPSKEISSATIIAFGSDEPPSYLASPATQFGRAEAQGSIGRGTPFVCRIIALQKLFPLLVP
jgi:hypothetical protein